MNSGKTLFFRLAYVLPVIAILIVITIFPLLYSLSLSFFFCDLRRGGRWIFAGLSNYALALFNDSRVWSSFRNTFFIGGPAIGACYRVRTGSTS